MAVVCRAALEVAALEVAAEAVAAVVPPLSVKEQSRINEKLFGDTRCTPADAW